MKKTNLTILTIFILTTLFQSCAKEEIKPDTKNAKKFIKTSYEVVYENIKETIYVEYEENGGTVKLLDNNSESFKKFLANNGENLSSFTDSKNTVYYYKDKETMFKAHNINLDPSLMKGNGRELSDNKNLKSVNGAVGYFLRHYGYNDYNDVTGHSLSEGNSAFGYALIPWVGSQWNDCISTIGSSFSKNASLYFILYADANYGGSCKVIERVPGSSTLFLGSVFRTNWPWANNWNDCVSSIILYQF